VQKHEHLIPVDEIRPHNYQSYNYTSTSTSTPTASTSTSTSTEYYISAQKPRICITVVMQMAFVNRGIQGRAPGPPGEAHGLHSIHINQINQSNKT